MIRFVAACLTLSSLLFATEANAQGLLHKRSRVVSVPGAVAPVQTAAAYPRTTYRPAATTSALPMTGAPVGVVPSRSYTYSYYSRSPLPARTYVGYGTDDFPFHGSPYGHPYDAYTFSAMAGSNSLARYYDPPVK